MSNRACCRDKCHMAIRRREKSIESVIISIKNTFYSTITHLFSPSLVSTQTLMPYILKTNSIASVYASTLIINSYKPRKYEYVYANNRKESLSIESHALPLRQYTTSVTNITATTLLEDKHKGIISANYALRKTSPSNFNGRNTRLKNESKICINLHENAILKENYNKQLPLMKTSETLRNLRKNPYFLKLLTIFFVFFLRVTSCHGLVVADPTYVGMFDSFLANSNSEKNNSILNRGYKNDSRIGSKTGTVNTVSSSATGATIGVGYIPYSGSAVSGSGAYLDIMDSLERSVAAVIIKVAYGTTSTTKRSIPENSYVPSLTTIATPPLTTLRYIEKSPHNQELKLHHRNYELDLERDHALPTSAPNADILKSNSNPTYPNPNRHHNYDREKHRNNLHSSPAPSILNVLKKTNNGQSPNILIYPGDIPSYSPPSRSFFTPPLPPEYQNPFADKPTLRGSNNEGVIANSGAYINRRPIPPPSLMPGHERIPYRPPDLVSSFASNGVIASPQSNYADLSGTFPSSSASNPMNSHTNAVGLVLDRKKTLNTPPRESSDDIQETTTQKVQNGVNDSFQGQPSINAHISRQEVLPSIRRILSGSNGNKGEIPEVLLKQVTSRPVTYYHQPPSLSVDNASEENIADDFGSGLIASSNINKNKDNKTYSYRGNDQGSMSNISPKTKMYTKPVEFSQDGFNQYDNDISSTPAAVTSENMFKTTSGTTSITKGKIEPSNPTSRSPSSSLATAAAAAVHATWAVAWNVHVYLSVILFTILGVYSFYKIITYNKLTHLFSQAYFICINVILIIICSSRIFFLCYDAYNIHGTLHLFVSEVLLNLPATLLTISFSVLILFLSRKTLNHKNNRYSALIRPLTVIVGCGVHVVLCITLHYVESYTMQNHQQHLYYQQQLYRRQQAQQQAFATTGNVQPMAATAAINYIQSATFSTPPPRVLSLICQFIYIFICLSLGSLYLYVYRILKRILRSKSQNYIHGFENLSYAIHITIATGLLFVLLAALQIFGAVSISMTRPLITQVTADMDWLQWGYQFSIRLIEIAIITLMSWVAGLKASGGGSDTVLDERNPSATSDGIPEIVGSRNAGNIDKHTHHYHHHHNTVAGFFLPCTSSSSQEQFDTDYPAVCNANTNLHTYTMRTGKLIYDDSFVLSSMGGTGQSISLQGGVRNADFQLQQQVYQHPYDTGSVQNSENHNLDFSSQKNHYQQHGLRKYVDYLTDATADHYENPNFELRACKKENVSNPMSKLTAHISKTSATGSCSGGSATSAASQQQLFLLQSESCYSEPIQPNCSTSTSYEFNHFERPEFVGSGGNGGVIKTMNVGNCSEPLEYTYYNREKKMYSNLERSAYENSEKQSSHSTQSYSNNGLSYNCFDIRNNTACVQKMSTLRKISSSDSIIHIKNDSSHSTPSSVVTAAQGTSNVQTLSNVDRNNLHQPQTLQLYFHGRKILRCVGINHDEREKENDSDSDLNFGQSTLGRSSNNSFNQLQKQHSLQHDSDGDIMLQGSNAECSNLISNDTNTCAFTNSSVVCVITDEELDISGDDLLLARSRKFSPVPPACNTQLGANNIKNSTSAGPTSVASSASYSAAELFKASTPSVTSGDMLGSVPRLKAFSDKNVQGVRFSDSEKIYHKNLSQVAKQEIGKNCQ